MKQYNDRSRRHRCVRQSRRMSDAARLDQGRSGEGVNSGGGRTPDAGPTLTLHSHTRTVHSRRGQDTTAARAGGGRRWWLSGDGAARGGAPRQRETHARTHAGRLKLCQKRRAASRAAACLLSEIMEGRAAQRSVGPRRPDDIQHKPRGAARPAQA